MRFGRVLSNHLGNVMKPSSLIDYSSSMFLKDDPQWTADFVEAGWNRFCRNAPYILDLVSPAQMVSVSGT